MKRRNILYKTNESIKTKHIRRQNMKTYEMQYEYMTNGNNQKTFEEGLTLRDVKKSFWQKLYHSEKQNGNLRYIKLKEENSKDDYCVFCPRSKSYIGLANIANPLSRSAIEKLFYQGTQYIKVHENKQ